MRKAFLPLLMILASVCSCADRSLYQQFDSLESIIFDHPDSVLKALEKIDTSLLRTDAMKARYSLLHATALDKNYIDTTDVSLITPAVEYYKKKGTPEQKLKVFYQLGRIQYNAGDLNNAAVSFTLSEREANQTTDEATKGLLYMTFSEIYNKIYNSELELAYIEKGIKAFDLCNDLKHKRLCSGRLALYHFCQYQWGKADSLFKAGIAEAKEDSIVMPIFLSEYARMKVSQPDPDPDGALSLLAEKTNSYNHSLSITDYGVYAYAAALKKDFSLTDDILKELSHKGLLNDESILFYLFSINNLRGNYTEAIDNLRELYENDLNYVKINLSHSVARSIQNHYINESSAAKKEAREMSFLISALSLILVLLLVSLYLYSRKRTIQKQNELERMLRLSEESNKLLEGNYSYLDKLSEDNKVVINSLHNKFTEIYKEKFALLGELCKAYYSAKERSDNKDVVYRRVESLIGNISNDETLHAYFESQLDEDLDNIVSHLRQDLNINDEQNRRFICYLIAGFDPKLISDLLGISLSNFYTKKSRLKEKIRSIESPYKDDYSRFL